MRCFHVYARVSIYDFASTAMVSIAHMGERVHITLEGTADLSLP